MPNAPTLGSVHANAALPNVAIGAMYQAFRLSGIAPIVPVKKESDIFYIWDHGAIRRNDARATAPGEKAPRTGFPVSTDTYSLEETKLAWPLFDRVRANMDPAIAAVSPARRVGEKIGLAAEVTCASVLTGTVWTGASSLDATPAGGGWDLGSGTDPLVAVETQLKGIHGKIGAKPNAAAFNWPVFRALRNHPTVIERLGVMPGTGQPGVISPAVANLMAIATILDIDYIAVVEANVNTANPGQTASYSYVLTDTMWIGYVAPNPSIDEPSALYTFMHEDVSTGEALVKTRTWREDDPPADVTEGRSLFQMKATMLDAGALITDILS